MLLQTLVFFYLLIIIASVLTSLYLETYMKIVSDLLWLHLGILFLSGVWWTAGQLIFYLGTYLQ